MGVIQTGPTQLAYGVAHDAPRMTMLDRADRETQARQISTSAAARLSVLKGHARDAPAWYV